MTAPINKHKTGGPNNELMSLWPSGMFLLVDFFLLLTKCFSFDNDIACLPNDTQASQTGNPQSSALPL
jgi:hypothetical protein